MKASFTTSIQEIEITKAENKTKIKAIVYGPLAVHQAMDFDVASTRELAITHVPSGLAIVKYPSAELALKAIKAILGTVTIDQLEILQTVADQKLANQSFMLHIRNYLNAYKSLHKLKLVSNITGPLYEEEKKITRLLFKINPRSNPHRDLNLPKIALPMIRAVIPITALH
jgi:hypothetical protein